MTELFENVSDKKDKTPHYHGHRDRVRDRFLKQPESLADYELLELILFQCIPRKDVKPFAKELLATFGDIAALCQASMTQLTAVNGVSDKTACHLKACHALAVRMGRTSLQAKPVLSHWQQVIEYCTTALAHAKQEQCRVLYLDSRNRLIQDVVHQIGTVNHAPVYPREIIKKAMEVSATALILVHNHPSGDAEPSQDDIVMTHAVEAAAQAVDIHVHDHLIISASGHSSLRNMGLLSSG